MDYSLIIPLVSLSVPVVMIIIYVMTSSRNKKL